MAQYSESFPSHWSLPAFLVLHFELTIDDEGIELNNNWACPCEKVQEGQSFQILFFFFLHKTGAQYHRIYFLLFLLPKSKENLINDVTTCCHYNNKFYYVVLKLNVLK